MIGRIIHLDGHPFTVIGVQPRDFPVIQIGTDADVTIPLHANAVFHPKSNMLQQNNVWWMSIFGRLRPGFNQAQANAEIAAMTESVFRGLGMKRDELPSVNHEPRQVFGVISGSHGNRLFASRYDKPLYVLIGIALAVLCIGSLNIANLLLARSVAREREFGVRLALGAGRFRLIRQLLTESLIMSAVGGLTGLLLAFGLTRSASHFISVGEIALDWRVFTFAAVISVLVTLLCGLIPAIRGVAIGADALRGGRVGQLFKSAQLSRVVVCTQVALSLALISSAFLLAKSFHALLTQNPGFVRDNLVFCDVDTERAGLSPQQTTAFFEQTLQRIRTTPGVTSSAITSVVPLTGAYAWSDLSEKDFPHLTPAQRTLYTHRVSPSYFRTMGIRLLAGRDFEDTDSTSGEEAAILSERAAKLYFSHETPIGRTLHLGDDKLRIIGVVSDARYQSIRDDAPQTLYYDILYANDKQPGITSGSAFFLVRSRLTTASTAAIIRQAAKHTGKDISVNNAMSFNQQAELQLITERLLTYLAAGFALIGCTLAGIGLYGVIAYSVTRRTSEIGVRMALGASRINVVWNVFSDAAKLILIGTTAGIGAALLSGRLLSALLYHTTPADPLVVCGTVLVLSAVAGFAGLMPALRAAAIDAMAALRWE